MRQILLAIALVAVPSSGTATAESLSPEQAKHFYSDLFAVDVSNTTAFPVVRQLPPEHPLGVLTADYKELLTFLLTNYADIDLHVLQKHASSSADASTYLVGDLSVSDRFNSLLLPIVATVLHARGISVQGVAPFAERTVSLSDFTRVAVRFFYVDGITPQGSFRAHVCVGINGLIDQQSPPDPILEALAFSAITRDIHGGQALVMSDFTRTLRHSGQLALSTNRETAISRAQGAMWLAMSSSQALRDILQQESVRTFNVLRISIKP